MIWIHLIYVFANILLAAGLLFIATLIGSGNVHLLDTTFVAWYMAKSALVLIIHACAYFERRLNER